jgi:hypothetical protein
MSVQTLNFRHRPCLALLLGLMGLCQSCVAQSAAIDAKRAALESEMNEAIVRVRGIVNQPVNALPRTPDMPVYIYKPGWFRPGAKKPDFSNVDVRTTQDTKYAKNGFLTSKFNPRLVWVGSQVEFNPMTKYFYADYSVPKKRLTEAEMLEINRLYRIIGRCEQELAALPKR